MAGLILLHIPKTAGTSVQDTVVGWVGPDHSATHIETIDVADRGGLGDRKFISGHLFYDEIQRLPYVRNFKLAVSFREPYARLASTLRMLDRFGRPENSAQFATIPKQAQEIAVQISRINFNVGKELAFFFQRISPWGRAALDNCQTRFLTCDPLSAAKSPYDELAPDALELAYSRLDTFDFIVLTEDLGESIARIAGELNYPPPQHVIHSNSATSSDWAAARSLDYNDAEIREAMMPLVERDLKLYARAVRLFESGLRRTVERRP